MNKTTKSTKAPVVKEEVVAVNDNTANSLSIIPDSIATTNVTPAKEPKVNDKSKAKAEPKPASKETIANLRVILSELPDKVTPKELDSLFGLYDGGKTVRRHLRNKFADLHTQKASWEWAKSDPVLFNILTYFAERYTPEIPVKTEAKAE